MQKKSKEEQHSSEVSRRTYRRPEIIMVEQLEAVAVDCTPNGKNAVGIDGCAFSAS